MKRLLPFNPQMQSTDPLVRWDGLRRFGFVRFVIFWGLVNSLAISLCGLLWNASAQLLHFSTRRRFDFGALVSFSAASLTLAAWRLWDYRSAARRAAKSTMIVVNP